MERAGQAASAVRSRVPAAEPEFVAPGGKGMLDQRPEAVARRELIQTARARQVTTAQLRLVNPSANLRAFLNGPAAARRLRVTNVVGVEPTVEQMAAILAYVRRADTMAVSNLAHFNTAVGLAWAEIAPPVVEAEAPVEDAEAPVVEAEAPVEEAEAPIAEAAAPVAEPAVAVAVPGGRDPIVVRFTQATISPSSGGHTVVGNADRLRIEPAWQLPAILVFTKTDEMNAWGPRTKYGHTGNPTNLENGQVYSLDNRRLKSYRLAGRALIPTQDAPPNVVRRQNWKFSTANHGTEVAIE